MLVDRLVPHKIVAEGGRSLERARIVVGVTVSLASGCAVLVPGLLIAYGGWSTTLASVLVEGVLLLTGLGLMHAARRPEPAGVLIVLQCFATLGGVAFLKGGLDAVNVVAWPVLPLMAATLLGRRAAVVTGVGVCGLMLWFWYLPSTGWVPEGYGTEQKRTVTLFGVCALVVLTSGIAVVHELARKELSDKVDATLDELRGARDAAEAASRAKTEFLARMSHEIRTPIHGVLGMNELLIDSELDDDQRQSALAIRRSAQTLVAVVDDVLDFSRLEAGRTDLRTERFDPRVPLNEAVGVVRPLAVERGLDLRATVEDDVPGSILGDPDRVRQVLINLVGNAVKYTEQGSVSITLRGGQRLRFEVRDTGVGLTEEAASTVFEPFTQADSFITRPHGGAGLGLAICRELTALMGGSLGVESTAGEGSLFWFDVPAIDPQEAPGRPLSSPGAAAVAGASLGGRILIVDDNEIGRQLAVRVVERLGCAVEVARNGREAVELARTGGYDLILMDCQMPGMDGYEAASEIRRLEPAGQRTPIVAVTAHALEFERQRCTDAGMDDYLAKPFPPDGLVAVVDRWLGAAVDERASS